MPFTGLLGRDRIVLVEAPLSTDAVLEQAAGLLAEPVEGEALPAVQLTRRLQERERMASTALGHGVAIPHGRVPGLEQARGAFLRLATPVDFAAPDGRPVDLVFAMAVPEHAVAGHLTRLAEIAEHFADAGFRSALRGARDPRELARLLLDETA